MSSAPSARDAEQLVCCAEDRPAQSLRVLQLLREKRLDLVGDVGRTVATERRFHPAGRKEDVARLLNLAKQLQGGRDESTRVRLAQRVVQILQRLEHPRLAPAVVDKAESV